MTLHQIGQDGSPKNTSQHIDNSVIYDAANRCEALWRQLSGKGHVANPAVDQSVWKTLRKAQCDLAHLASSRTMTLDEIAAVTRIEMMILRDEMHSQMVPWRDC